MNWRHLLWLPVAVVVLPSVLYITYALQKRPTWQQLLVVLLLAVLSFVASWAGNRILHRNVQAGGPP